MGVKTQTMHEGKLYYSMPAAARLLGTTTPKLKKLLIPEGFEWTNLRENGPIWVGAESIAGYLSRRGKT
jgi:hypothetical protein